MIRIYDYKGTALPSLYKFNLWKLLAFSIADLLTMVGMHVKIILNFWEEITMKKILAILLCTAMLLGMTACASGGSGDTGAADTTAAAGNNETTGQLMVGYSAVIIDPTESVPLRGYGSTEKRMSNGFKSHLYHIAIAITDTQGNTGILISADACSAQTAVADAIREGIERECGVPAENVILTNIHQHSTPDMTNSKAPTGIEYKEDIFIPKAIEAAKLAMENRTVTTAVQTTSLETENMNFVRHYKMEDGSYAGPNFGNNSLTAVEHTTEVDNEMQLVKFIREGQTTPDGKPAKNIVLINYQGHPLMGASATDTNVHSDLVGVMRDELAKDLNCEVIYISGSSGNMMFTSQIAAEKHGHDYKEHGKALAKVAAKAEGTYKDIAITSVKVATKVFTAECNHTEDHLVPIAKEAQAEYNATNDKKVVEKYGFNSIYHVSATISHANLPATRDITFFVMAFGQDLVFTATPFEMFCDTGMEIKEGSPFTTTIVCYIGNGANGYLPTEAAWDYNCYEKNNSNFVRGTAEKVGQTYIEMLSGLYEEY